MYGGIRRKRAGSGPKGVEAGGKVLREIELVAAEAVPALGFFDIWKQMLGTVCMAG